MLIELKRCSRSFVLSVLVPVLALMALPVSAEWNNEIEVEYRYFFNDPQFAEQGRNAAAIVYRPVWSAVSGNSVYDFRGIARFDENDEERNLLDVTELSWLHTLNDWEFKVGLSKVFWGVAETQHLVDIINQTDLADDIDGESKLGQPMIRVSKTSNIGVFDAYVLPYFRERTFAGSEGRLRTQPVVNTDLARYESSDEQSHLDYALRWSHTVGAFDVGLSYFDGTGRDPVLTISEDNRFLVPNYVQIQQVGLDIQATFDAWLWKFEAIDRSASDIYASENFQAAVGGFEYTFFNIADSGADIGIVAEHSYDSRGNQSVGDDLTFLGLRVALNDEQSTDLLLGCSANGELCSVEGSRRLGESFKLSLRANTFSGIEDDSLLASQRQDDYIQFSLAYFF